MATEENMKAIQSAINAGMGAAELLDSFLEEVVWDCVVVLSGNEDTSWALLDHMDGNLQTVIEDWQYEIVNDYVAECQDKQTVVTL